MAMYPPPPGDTADSGRLRAARRLLAPLRRRSSTGSCLDRGHHQGDLGAVGYGVTFVVGSLYFTVLIGSARGQTLGQMAMGIRVIDFNGGRTDRLRPRASSAGS